MDVWISIVNFTEYPTFSIQPNWHPLLCYHTFLVTVKFIYYIIVKRLKLKRKKQKCHLHLCCNIRMLCYNWFWIISKTWNSVKYNISLWLYVCKIFACRHVHTLTHKQAKLSPSLAILGGISPNLVPKISHHK